MKDHCKHVVPKRDVPSEEQVEGYSLDGLDRAERVSCETA
jgi:hypothetical protein